MARRVPKDVVTGARQQQLCPATGYIERIAQMHHAGATVPCPNLETVTFRRDSYVEIQSQAVYRPLFEELWGGFLTLLTLRFGCGSPLFGIQKSVGAGTPPVLRRSERCLQSDREHVCGSLS